VSADVGPDLIVPWRRPSLVILYAKRVIDPASGLGLIDAQGRHDASVIVRMPDDQSVFSGHVMTAQAHGGDVPLADPLQQIWDLQDLGGADRLRDISYRQVAGNRFAGAYPISPSG
jgi:hypothetical protein